MSMTNSAPSTRSAIKEQLRGFILENLAQPKGIASFGDDERLMETGIIDSLDVFRLISFLEDELGVRVEDQEINPETLKSLNSLEEFVARKRGIQ
jgi:acyl carrier protein